MNEKLISKYRTEMMGFAALWIGVLHAQMWFRFPLLQAYKLSGQGGVDLFLFLSGFGLYYAGRKGESGWNFYKKRLYRILPLYIPAVIARCYYFHYDLTWSLMFATGYSFWRGFDRSYWYVTAILVLYAAAAVYLKYFNDGREKKMTVISVVSALLLSFCFLHTTQLTFFARVPVFFLGFYFGYRAYHQMPDIPHWNAICVLCFLIGAVWLYAAFRLDVEESVLFGLGMYWYPNILMIPAMAYLLSRLFQWFDDHHLGGITKFHHFAGTVSLPIYLLHDLCMRYFGVRIPVPATLSYNGIFQQTVILFLTVIIAWIYQKAVFGILEWIGRKNA